MECDGGLEECVRANEKCAWATLSLLVLAIFPPIGFAIGKYSDVAITENQGALVGGAIDGALISLYLLYLMTRQEKQFKRWGLLTLSATFSTAAISAFYHQFGNDQYNYLEGLKAGGALNTLFAWLLSGAAVNNNQLSKCVRIINGIAQLVFSAGTTTFVANQILNVDLKTSLIYSGIAAAINTLLVILLYRNPNLAACCEKPRQENDVESSQMNLMSRGSVSIFVAPPQLSS